MLLSFPDSLSGLFFALLGVYLFFTSFATKLHFFLGVFFHFITGADRRCQNPECGQNIAISDEALAGLVDGLLRELAQAPHLLIIPEPRQTGVDMEAVRLQNELTLALNRGDENPGHIKTLALAAAAQRYSQIPDPTPAHDLEQLRARLEEGPADANTLSALLDTAVRAVRLAPDKTVDLELVNGQIITEAKEESA